MIKGADHMPNDERFVEYALKRLEDSLDSLRVDVRSTLITLVPRGEHRIEMDGTNKRLDDIGKRLETIEGEMVKREDLQRIEKRVEGGPLPRWLWQLISISIALIALWISMQQRGH